MRSSAGRKPPAQTDTRRQAGGFEAGAPWRRQAIRDGGRAVIAPSAADRRARATLRGRAQAVVVRRGRRGRVPMSSRAVRTRPEPRTEAERRAAEVRARRAPRKPVDPNVEREQIEQRQTEQWVDEGSIRAEAQAATARAASPRPRRETTIDPEVLAEVQERQRDPKRAERLAERLTSAAAALDRERFDDARRMVAPVVRELPSIAAGHEINGLANYRMGRWREAAASLEEARHLRPDPALLPVLADCYRAMKRWTAVDAMWREIRELSPSHEVMAEARIVVAGAHADRGELQAGDRADGAGAEGAEEGARLPPPPVVRARRPARPRRRHDGRDALVPRGASPTTPTSPTPASGSRARS